MEILRISLTAVLSVIELFILTKIMGNRQMSQMSMFDYINGITIGSIAADMAFCEIDEFWKPALAAGIYGLIAVIVSESSNKSIKFRRFFEGKALIIMNNGEIYRSNLKKAKIDVNELLTQCRVNGYFNIDELQTVIMETNGQLSFLPKSDVRPTIPKDLGMTPPKDESPAILISDGRMLTENLYGTGKNEIWLREELKKIKAPPIEKIYLAMCDSNNKLLVFKMNNEKKDNFYF